MAQSVLNNPRRRRAPQRLVQQRNVYTIQQHRINKFRIQNKWLKFLVSLCIVFILVSLCFIIENRQCQTNKANMSNIPKLEEQGDKKQQFFQNKQQNNRDEQSKNQHKIKSFQELQRELQKNNFAQQFRNKISKTQHKKQKRAQKQANNSNKSIQTKKLQKQDKFFKLQSAHVAISFKIYLQNCQNLSLDSSADPTLFAKKFQQDIQKCEQMKKQDQSLPKKQENINEQENPLQIQNQSKDIKIIPQRTRQSKRQHKARNYVFPQIPNSKKIKKNQIPNRSQLKPIQSQQIEQSQQKSENIENKGKRDKR